MRGGPAAAIPGSGPLGALLVALLGLSQPAGAEFVRSELQLPRLSEEAFGEIGFAPADLDADGDLDLLAGGGGGGIRFFENTGTAAAPAFAAREREGNPFDCFSILFASPSAADLDADGGLDLLAGNGLGDFELYRSAAPRRMRFEEVSGSEDPLAGLASPDARSAPALGDLDGDGDPDLVSGRQSGFLLYFENTGTPSAPVFSERTGAQNPFAAFSVAGNSTPALVDLDADGDLDCFAGPYVFLENTGTPTAPAFVRSASPLDGVAFTAENWVFADLDGDGDQDAFTAAPPGSVAGARSLENIGSATAPVFVERFCANPVEHLRRVDAFWDVDGDGDLDLFGEPVVGFLAYYENVGSAAAARFAPRGNPLHGQGLGGSEAFAFADLDADGLLDAVAGDSPFDAPGNPGGFRVFFHRLAPLLPVPGWAAVAALGGIALASRCYSGSLFSRSRKRSKSRAATGRESR